MRKVYNKLIRDNIPAIIKSSGKVCDVEVLDDKNYLEKLIEKFSEEVAELREEVYQDNKDNIIEELADIQELIYAVLDYYGSDKIALDKVTSDKAQKRGGFSKRLLLKEVRDSE